MDPTQLVRQDIHIEYAPVQRGHISKVLPSVTEGVMVILPEGSTEHLYGPCKVAALWGITTPEVGKACVVVFDEQNQPTVVWWDGVYGGEGGIVSVKDYGATGEGEASYAADLVAFDAAFATVAALGGGTVFVPDGVYVPPALGYRVPSNVTVQLADGAIIRPNMVHGGTNACGFQNTKAGWGEDPTPYNGNDNIHIEGGWIDLTEVDAKTGNIGIELLGCRDSSVDCKCTGGAYGVILGGAGTAGETPCQRIKVRGTFFPLNANSTGGVAVTNCEDYDVDVMVRCPDASGTTLCLDCEPNAPTDTLKGGRIKGNFYGGRVITQSAAATDPDRMAGIDLSGINLHDGATMTIATPGTVVNGYTVTASGSPAGGFPNVAISVERTAPSATMAADGTTISGGTIRDVPASNTFPGIKVQDASYCMIAGNAVVDDRPTSYTTYAVEEKVLLEHVVSGCAASAGAGMKVKVAAGEVESEAKAKQAVAGNEVTIEAADALKERVDLIVVKLSTGVASIVKGGYPVQPELPAPALLAAAPYTPAGYTPVARVVVKAAVTEIKAANILDNRLFATNNNVLGPTVARGTLSGTHKKVGANTKEVVPT